MKTKGEIELAADKYSEEMWMCHPMERSDYKEAFLKGVQFIENQDPWISVKDKLPEAEGRRVLGTLDSGKLEIVFLFKGEWCYDEAPCEPVSEYGRIVTHWMPFPNPPKTTE